MTNNSTGINFEPLPFHVLFPKSTIPENMTAGIGIDSEADLESYIVGSI